MSIGAINRRTASPAGLTTGGDYLTDIGVAPADRKFACRALPAVWVGATPCRIECSCWRSKQHFSIHASSILGFGGVLRRIPHSLSPQFLVPSFCADSCGG